MDVFLVYPIVIPILLGFVCYLIPKKVKYVPQVLTVMGSLGGLVIGFWLFFNKPLAWGMGDSVLLKLDSLSGFVFLASALFGFLITLYSLKFMQGKTSVSMYYGSILCTIGAAFGAILANHLIVLLIFWGFLGITLYLLVLTGGSKTAPAAKKTLVIVGGTDALLLLGIVFIYSITSTFQMDKISLPFDGALIYISFILLTLAAMAKAGAMPLHTWIPDVAETAPIPVTAYLPAALDKLLGIYLLGRMCLHLFVLPLSMNLMLLIIGSITIIAAVMMALIQHDMRKLLAYHAVSQVGYMVLGIGTGNPIGIAGGLFHMLNHSIYKSCLFLAGGAVQHKTDTTDLDKLGGLGRMMPLTFIAFLIAAFAISGIPPFNGFVSKWMVYQGLIEMGSNGSSHWIIWLVAAMFGSVLTLASFMKLTHSVFLGVPSENIEKKKIRDAGPLMSIPMAILALLCVVFGVFAFAIPLKLFLLPSVPGVIFTGAWSPGLATILILVGLVVGFIIYLLGNLKGIREAEPFIGGEKLPIDKRVTGTGFYNTIQDTKGIKKMYTLAKLKWFDIYEQADRLSSGISGLFRKAHTGILNSYVLWICMGLSFLFIMFILVA